MSSKLSKKRIEALLELAGRGEDEFVAQWGDDGIDLLSSDSEIRADAKENNFSVATAIEAANIVRSAQEARVILRERYLT